MHPPPAIFKSDARALIALSFGLPVFPQKPTVAAERECRSSSLLIKLPVGLFAQAKRPATGCGTSLLLMLGQTRPSASAIFSDPFNCIVGNAIAGGERRNRIRGAPMNLRFRTSFEDEEFVNSLFAFDAVGVVGEAGEDAIPCLDGA